jgi:hypothetical protein
MVLQDAIARSSPVERSTYFMPERLTPLFHTPLYAQLTDAQRLRYNQFHACYLNEQTMFFEVRMARQLLQSMASMTLPEGLADGLRQFMLEEAQHSKMFRDLNRKCLPEIYNNTDFYFIQVPQVSLSLLNHWVRRAKRFPFFLWILLIQEERALFYGRQFLNEDESLDAEFVTAQRRHLSDEAGHIRWDEQLLDHVWPRTSKAWRIINARLFTWMMGEFFTTPRRGGLRVVAEIVKEFPELQSLWPELQEQMLQLSTNREFNLLCYSRTVTPKSFARFDHWPEFHSLGRVLTGYCPPSTSSKSRQ